MASLGAGPSNPFPNVSRFQSRSISDAGSDLFDPYHPTHIAADVNMTTDKAEYPTTPLPYPQNTGQAEPFQNRIHGATHHMPRDGKYLGLACLYLISCVVVVCWMMIGGPKLVPRQDTRITNIIISIMSKGALALALWIVTLRLRVQWTHILVSRKQVQLRSLLAACSNQGSLSRVRRIRTSPTRGIGLTAVIGAAVTILMTLTSAGFKYIVLPGTAIQEFSGPDFVSICNYSLVNSTTGYFCVGTANTATINIEYHYLDTVSSGAGGNVVRSNGTSGPMSANVTLTSAPANLRLPANPTPPWTAIDVSCRNVTISLTVVGNGSSSTNVLFVDNRQLDTLTVAEMLSWSSQVQLYQQVNDTGPASSLSPWYMVLLARDLDDGTSNLQGLSGSAVTYLGNSFLDLHGYTGPVLQGVLGAAAYCTFSGSTGGTWPSATWPARTTTNVVVGKAPYNDTIDISTVFLNYGPSWQYNPVSANSLPGGSVSYIANMTTEADNFGDFIAMCMRNQWALMMYTNNFIQGFITNTPYHVKTQPQLYIQATTILVAPASALGVCVLCAFVCMFTMSRLGDRYGLVDVAPWWLIKATGVACGMELRHETTKSEFETLSNNVKCVYSDEVSDTGIRQLRFTSNLRRR